MARDVWNSLPTTILVHHSHYHQPLEVTSLSVHRLHFHHLHVQSLLHCFSFPAKNFSPNLPPQISPPPTHQTDFLDFTTVLGHIFLICFSHNITVVNIGGSTIGNTPCNGVIWHFFTVGHFAFVTFDKFLCCCLWAGRCDWPVLFVVLVVWQRCCARACAGRLGSRNGQSWIQVCLTY